MQWYDGLTLVLAAGACVLALVGILRMGKRSEDEGSHAQTDAALRALAEQIGREFSQSRQESAGSQTQFRDEQTRTLAAMRRELQQELVGVKEGVQKEMSGVKEGIGQEMTVVKDGLSRALEALLTQSREVSQTNTRSLNDAVRTMQENNEKKLEQMRATVDEKLSATLNERLGASFKQVSEQLTSVYTALGEMKTVGEGVSGLQRLLTNVSVRGAWAETQLENILNQTIPGHFERQFALELGSAQRVDFAVRIPSSDGAHTYLPVDSKFPREDYERLCQASEQGDLKALEIARKHLAARVRDEAKTIAEKYIRPPVTTPYAILYLPTEGLFAELCRAGVMDDIQDAHHVLLAGPTTITALLNAVSAGFRAVAVNEKANEIQKILAAAKAQFGKFEGILIKAEDQIRRAGESIHTARTTRLDAVNRELRSIVQLDSSVSDEVLGLPAAE
ncbi:MAG: DNA recombination protein RmuC [Oscillospiraceae bacterium]|jgi:DNA recombination protein RmuC|nr:DNA recombination protein RmuC [Oscillospiraceae bacterium]